MNLAACRRLPLRPLHAVWYRAISAEHWKSPLRTDQTILAPTRPLVVTTIFPLWDLTRHVAGDRAEAQAQSICMQTQDFKRAFEKVEKE